MTAAHSAERWRIVHSEASPGWGGQERRIMVELEGFRRRGHQTWLLATAHSEIFRRAEAVGVGCEVAEFARRKFPFAVLRVAAWLRRVRPHVVNTHSSRDGWLVGVAGRLACVPLIVRTRHFDVPIANKHLSGFVYSRLADHVLTTSPRVTEHFRSLFKLSADRITTLPTGVDLEEFSPDGPRAELVTPDRQRDLPLIGMVSIIRRAKGHETLLAAARQLRDRGLMAYYVVVGEGPYLPRVQARMRELKMEDCVTLAGRRDDVPAVLRALNVLAIPSLHEGVPQIGLQALAVGTPVVASNVGGLPTIIRHGETGRLVPPGDAGALAQALWEALTEPACRKAKMCEAGRALVEKSHGLENMLDQLEALYRRHLNGSP